jgi:hypothetical protein
MHNDNLYNLYLLFFKYYFNVQAEKNEMACYGKVSEMRKAYILIGKSGGGGAVTKCKDLRRLEVNVKMTVA